MSGRRTLPFWNCGPADSTQPQGGGVRSFVDGFLTPLVACVQPQFDACGTDEIFYDQEPHENDILCGKGTRELRHPGNINFRELAQANRSNYSALTKKQKMMFARSVVDMVHQMNPPGRFLARDKTGQWNDIGLSRSLEKVSQAMRESKSAKEAAVVSPEDLKDSSSKRSGKFVEAPTVIIPPNLQHKYRLPPPSIFRTPVDSQSISRPIPQQQVPSHFRPAAATSFPQYPAILRNNSMPVDSIRPPAPPNVPKVFSYDHVVHQPYRDIGASASFDSTASMVRERDVESHYHLPSALSEMSSDDSTIVSINKRQKTTVTLDIENRLSLDDKHGTRSLLSPSGMIQGRGRQRDLDGLAALSTAAFLRLDETD